MKIKILCVGKLKEKYLTDACGEYLKRLAKYCKVEITELSESRLKEEGASYVELVRNEESNKILNKLSKQDFNILLSLRGKEHDSLSLAKCIKTKMDAGHSSFCFIIGGSYGTVNELEKKVDMSLCLSKLTFPHQLTRVILLEQIYRVFKILNNENYHK